MPRWIPQFCRSKIAVVVVVLMAMVLGVVLARKLITNACLFLPEKGQERTPLAIGLDFEDLRVTSSDGVRTEAWWLPHSEPKATLVFFHGNAGTMADRLENAAALHDLGFSVLMAEYRGYGNSEGRPSERGLFADAQAAVRLARQRSPDLPVVVFGRSLGGAVAIDVASREPVDGLVVESTFTSLPAVARAVIPVPLIWRLAAYDFASIDKIGAINCPTLIIHGDADELVPFSMGEQLREASGAGETRFLRVPGGGHNDTWGKAGSTYWVAWRGLLDQVLGASSDR